MIRVRVSGALVVLVALCLATSSCKKKEGDTCEGPDSCADGLHCVDSSSPSKCLSTAQATAACRASTMCTDGGKCTLDESSGNCLAKTEADCAQSTGCKKGGACTLSGTGYCK